MAHHRASRRRLIRHTALTEGASRVRQRGSFAVMGAVWLLLALIVLGSIDIGHLYFQRRDLQRIADGAAQAGVQTIDDNCSLAPTTALAVANTNENGSNSIALSTSAPSVSSPPAPTSTSSDLLAVQCGRWDPTAPPTAAVSGTSPYFSPKGTTTAVTPLNAVWVQVARKVPYFFLGPTRTVTALATARASQIDVFSLSSTLANINTSNSPLLNPLLSALLGGAVNLTVADYQSLANANISLANLAAELGVGSVSELATVSPIKLSTFLADLTGNVSVLQAGNGTTSGDIATLKTALSILSNSSKIGTLSTAVSDATINIANPSGSNPLLNLGLGTAQAGATASVDLLDLLMASAEIANGTNTIAVNIPSALSLPSISIPGASTTSATVASLQLQILQPPSIAVGESGIVTKNGTTVWRTQASQAQIGVYLDVTTPTITIGTGSLLNLLSLGSLLNVSLTIQGINLPIYLLVGGPSKAGLAATSCNSTISGPYGTTTAAGSDTATIVVQPGVTQLCLSSPPSGTLSLGSNYNSSTQIFSCPAVPATGLPLLSIQAQASLLGSLISYSSSLISVSAAITNPLLNLSATPTATAPYTGSVPASVTSLNQPSGTYSFCTAPGNTSSPVACGGNWNSPPANGTNSTSYVTVNSNSLGSELGNAVSKLGLSGLTLTVAGVSVPLSTSWLQSLLGDILTPIGTWLDSILVPVLSLLGVQVGQATVHQISMSCNAPQIVY